MTDEIIAEIKGYISEIDVDYIKITFKQTRKMQVYFPKDLFKEQEKFRYGENIKYQIKKDKDGNVYQHFEIDTDPVEVSKETLELKEKLLKILDNIKCPDED